MNEGDAIAQIGTVVAKVDGMPVVVSPLAPKNEVFVLAPQNFADLMPVKQEIIVAPADKSFDSNILERILLEMGVIDEPNRPWLGWVVHEEVGFAVINDTAVAKIKVSG